MIGPGRAGHNHVMVHTAGPLLLDVQVGVAGHPQRYARQLRSGGRLVLGRRGGKGELDRLGIAPEWLGVQRDQQVSAELLGLRHEGGADGVRVAWRTRSRLYPTGLRVGPVGPDPDGGMPSGTNADAAGALTAGIGRPAWLHVYRLDARRVFRHRLAVRLVALEPAAGPGDEAATDDGTLLGDDVAAAVEEIRRNWLDAGRDRGPGVLSWRVTLVTTLAAAGSAPPGGLADAVAAALAGRYPQADVARVRRDWSDALHALAALARQDRWRWIVDLLAVPGLAEYLQGEARRLAAGEPQLRQLAAALAGDLDPSHD
jgi:hypothetical protein